MKKLHLVAVFALAPIVSAPVFAAGGVEVKAGVASVKSAGDKAGFDAGVAYAIRLERFFAIVPEVNFNWLNYDGAATTISGTGLGTTATPSVSLYTLPMLLNARLYIPMGADETPTFQPYVTVGAGYGLASYINKTPNQPTLNETLGGLMYQASLGFALNLGMMSEGSASSTSIIFEVGYRGGQLEKNLVKFDYGGYVIRAGASFSM